MQYLELKPGIRFRRQIYTLLTHLREDMMREAYHVHLMTLSFRRNSFASLNPFSEIHHPLTDKNIAFTVEDCCVTEVQLSGMTYHGGIVASPCPYLKFCFIWIQL